MAPLTRTFSLPISLPDRIARLKVFSGAAGKDEVSKNDKSQKTGPPLETLHEGVEFASSLAESPVSSPVDFQTSSPFHHEDPPMPALPSPSPQRRDRLPFGKFRRKSSLEEEQPEVTLGPKLTTRHRSSSTPSSSHFPHTTSLEVQASTSTASVAPPKTSPADRRASWGLFGGNKASGSGAVSPTSPPDKSISPPIPSIVLQPSQPIRANSVGPSDGQKLRGRRSSSPFFRARKSRENARARDKSPDVRALTKDPDSDGESVGGGSNRRFRPAASAYDDGDESGTEPESDGEGSESPDEANEDDGEDNFDEETEKNTVANAVYAEGDAGELGGEVVEDAEKADISTEDDQSVFDRYGEEIEQDPTGEGPNVIVPPKPLFQTSTMNPPRRRKSQRNNLELTSGRPSFGRDRCTVMITQGDPDDALEASGKRLRRYVVLSDLSEESRYAVEWAIGTVARNGDEIFVISVKEDESKVDPKDWNQADKTLKLKVQRERQGTTLALVRQVTELLQRTRLNITVTCQALHAKNARHMLLDLIDFLEPTMAIVGSRGLGKLKGILLGSTSHYLVQKSSVPVMVARRRLQRPLRKTDPAHLRHSPRVSLASASIEKTATAKQEDEDMDVAHEEQGTTSVAETPNEEK